MTLKEAWHRTEKMIPARILNTCLLQHSPMKYENDSHRGAAQPTRGIYKVG
jgi:hypothetical protein